MTALRILVEVLRAIPDVVRTFRSKPRVEQRVVTEPIKPATKYPSASIINAESERRDF